MKAKGPLGRGLDALISEEEIFEASSSGFFMCPIERLSANPRQPRRDIDEASLKGLADSIREKGILQPLIVRKVDIDERGGVEKGGDRIRRGVDVEDKGGGLELDTLTGEAAYEIIAGERRFRAALLAGIKTVPVVIKDVSPEEVLELALIENIQRQDLTPIEEALAYKRLIEDYKLTHTELSRRIGRDRSTITNSLRLLRLPEEIKDALNEGRISMGHARALVPLADDEGIILPLFKRICQEGISVRQTEAMVRAIEEERKGRAQDETCGHNTGAKKMDVKEKDDPTIRRLCDELTYAIGFRVNITHKRRGGKVEIYYNDLDDLDRIVELLERN